jgi:hypothetical protein
MKKKCNTGIISRVCFAVKGILSKTYWSSGYGASALSFGWCTANAKIDARLWKLGEPGAATGCVSATFPKMPKNATGERQKRVRLLFSKVNYC